MVRRDIGTGELVRDKWRRRVRLRLRVVEGEATGTADAESLKSGREVPTLLVRELFPVGVELL